MAVAFHLPRALPRCCQNFAAKYGYTYPDYDENVSRYVRDMYAEYEAK
mgnify:CR=1 FL=1